MSLEAETVATLREVRVRLARPDTPSRVNLREYIPQDSSAWKAFVDTHRQTPGYRVKRSTMIRWLDEVIGEMDGAVLNLENSERVEETSLAIEQVEPPSPRDLHRAGDRTGTSDTLPPRLDTSQIERELVERAAATLDGDDLAMARWSGLGSIDDGLEDWYYGPEIDEAAREERTNLSTAQREERARRWAEQRAREEGQAPGSPGPTPPTPNAAASTPIPSPASGSGGMPLRALTEAGMELAREFLAHLHENPEADRTPPDKLLRDERYSRLFSESIRVERRPFSTRREAGSYLAPVLAPIRHRIIDNAGVWSWLGMYYFAGTAPTTLSPNNMTFIFDPGENSAHASRSEQQRYRHYLWGSWRLYEQNAHHADFLLDQEISSWDDISERIFGSRRVFGSAGVVPLILRLYTEGPRKKRGHVGRPGGLRHLLRVLPQLELTYDVYGMQPDALLEVLPPVFGEWDTKSA